MLDFIVFAENKYPTRKVAIEGYESALMISTEDLEAVLISSSEINGRRYQRNCNPNACAGSGII